MNWLDGEKGRRLIIVANRLPYRIGTADGKIQVHRTVGGLVSALQPLAATVGATWVGWDDGQTAAWSRASGRSRIKTEFPIVPVELPERIRQPFYGGFCNATLWPLFHGFLGRCEFQRGEFEAYEKGNSAFAAKVRSIARPGDTIWIHDYHLMLMPSLLREAGVRSRILFFLHIPFPSVDLFSHLPWRREILKGLSGADVVGLQGPSNVRHMREALDLFPVELTAGRGRGSGPPEIRSLPISIDTQRLASLARSDEISGHARALKRGFHGRKVVLSVERMDYAKGIVERLRAIEHLFEKRPDLRGRVSFLQLSVPSRAGVRSYDRYRREVDEMVGRLNGRFSRPEWSPVRYLFRSLPEADLLAYYLAADVCLVTSLNDGMNLVAKEYVASRRGDDGVLVLSEFAGATHELGRAMKVNPHDVVALADAIARAIEMPREERRSRMKSMFAHVKKHTVHDWIGKCLA